MNISFGFGAAGLFLAIAWYFVKKLEHNHPLDMLEHLGKLRDASVIDDDEYESLRNRQIKRLKSID